jgi:hypothetical protein
MRNWYDERISSDGDIITRNHPCHNSDSIYSNDEDDDLISIQTSDRLVRIRAQIPKSCVCVCVCLCV